MGSYDYKTFLNKCSQESIIIYGEGYLATEFYEILSNHKIGQNVKCFAVTSGLSHKKNGIDVLPIDEITDIDVLVCICVVYEDVKQEILKTLSERGFQNVVWIYPMFYSLCFGTPLIQNKEIEISDIWRNNISKTFSYAMAVRYVAAEQYYGKRNDGYEIYMDYARIILNGKERAINKLKKYIELMDRFETYGYDSTYPSSIFEDGIVLDGMHRISLASYKNYNKVCCNIYAVNEKRNKFLANDICRENALVLGMKKEHIDELERVNMSICRKYR